MITSGTWGLSGDTLTLTKTGGTTETVSTAVIVNGQLYLSNHVDVGKGQSAKTSLVNTWNSSYTSGNDHYQTIYTFDNSGNLTYEFIQPSSDETSSGNYSVNADSTIIMTFPTTTVTYVAEIVATSDSSYLLMKNGSGSVTSEAMTKQ